MNGGGGGLRPCEVRITASRKRTAPSAVGPFNGNFSRQPEPLPVQIKRKNCPYVYRKDGQDGAPENDYAAPDFPQQGDDFAAPHQAPADNGNMDVPFREEPGQIVRNNTSNVIEEMARLYPDLSVANLQMLLKNAESARNQTLAIGRQTEVQTIKCSRIPVDWSLKTTMQINLALIPDDDEFVAQVRRCSDADAIARAIINFIDTYSSSKSVTGHHNLTGVLSSLRAAAKMWCLSSISFLNNGALSRNYRGSLESSRPLPQSETTALFDELIRELNAKWLTGLLSIFNLTKIQTCPYFYIIDDRCTILIGNSAVDAPGDPIEGNPFSKLVASIAPAPPVVVSWLKKAKIDFTALNEADGNILFADNAKQNANGGEVVADSVEDGDDDDPLAGEGDNEKGSTHDDADSLSYFEELGIASMILENLKADGKVAEQKKQPLTRAVLIRGRAVLTLVNLLVETRGFPIRLSTNDAPNIKRAGSKADGSSSSSSRFPLPAILAPCPFDCASINSFRVRIAVAAGTGVAAVPSSHAANKTDSGSLTIHLTGGLPMPPFILHRTFACLIANGRSFTAQAETWQAKSQAEFINSSLSSTSMNTDTDTNLVINKQAPPKLFTSASFASGFFNVPTV